MNIEDIKVGETYNVRVKIVRVNPEDGDIEAVTVNKEGEEHIYPTYFSGSEAAAFSPINPYEPIKLFLTNEIPARFIRETTKTQHT